MKRIYKARVPILFINLLTVMSLLGCGATNSDHGGNGDDGTSSKDKNTNATAPIIKGIHLYLDNSASMGGYYQANTEYKTIITDLAVKMDKEITPIDINYIADKTVPYKKTIAQFTSDIATTPMAMQKSSELQKMIGDIASNCGSNDVALLISDCILSFPNAAIKADPNVNKNNAASTLKNNIYATFVDLKNKGFGASIYAFNSKFYGTYYDFQNQKHKLKGISRPFYVWAIARKPLLSVFNAKLSDISSFKPESSLTFGLGEKPVTKYDILAGLEHKGDWSKGDPESGYDIEGVDVAKGEPVPQIGLVLNLQGLPTYAQNINYLKNNLVITPSGCSAKFLVENKVDVNKSKLSQSQMKAFDDCSHVLLLSITDMALKQAKVRFNLPLNYDTSWCFKQSTMDDRNPIVQQNTTFAFEYLIKGVLEAYETKNKNYIDFTLSLTK